VSDNIPASNGNVVSLPAGRSASSSTDWDTFEVPAGWCATYVQGDFHKGKTISRVDRRGQSAIWVKFGGITSRINVEIDKTCTWAKSG
jgi:hypothetical protein